jgi:hypothetical protein
MKRLRDRIVQGRARFRWAVIVGVLVAAAFLGALMLIRRCPFAPCPSPPGSLVSFCVQALLRPCPIDAVDLLVAVVTGAATGFWIVLARRPA